ncbi:hypothetical protein BO79DRAFT_255103 [Aspergillus costaricaensis CBS 115574]|uniref:Uncharacterized protein n=1 Tax=Aspergillus costaricaensis CBS 115574 TaxID=1448317 RepID=A0ACD1IEQ4_9EURO|nr:hypothetical protein BO79DRAFT_255103 [Aspergillus costaricaensis CBS 115574]RAK89054.1 hypothetical protein BO79DRAFT_255103 [Aspergillus costaricaensis CBS 115574]
MLSHWFSESEISPGAVIEMEKSWTVVQACEEHISHYSKDQGSPGHPPASDVTIRLISAGTEAEPAAVRSKQAKPCEPDELIALRALTNKRSRFTPRLLDSKNTTQDDSGFVPGGFLVYVAWEVVAGEQLGTEGGDEYCGFWRMERDKREIVREHFKNNFLQLSKWGYMPLGGRLSNLVWDEESSTLFIVGFYMATTNMKKKKWSPAVWFAWGLAKCPRPPGPDWDGSTSDWEW